MRAVPSLSLLAATLLLGCGSDGGMDPGDGPGPPASVSVTPSSRTVELPDGTVSFTATARDAEGRVMSGASFTWTNSDADVAVAGGGGAVETVGPGVATITATTGSVSGAATVTVTGEAGSEVMRALTRLRPDGRSWIYAWADGSRRRMQVFVEPGAAPTTGECDGAFEDFDPWMGEWDVTTSTGPSSLAPTR